MKKKKLFFKECHLAGRQYHDANEVWEELKVGTLLELQRDQENPYDKNAVAVVYSKMVDNNEKEEYLLGYLPRTSNTEIAAHPTNPVEGCADANPKTELPNDT